MTYTKTDKKKHKKQERRERDDRQDRGNDSYIRPKTKILKQS